MARGPPPPTRYPPQCIVQGIDDVKVDLQMSHAHMLSKQGDLIRLALGEEVQTPLQNAQHELDALERSAGAVVAGSEYQSTNPIVTKHHNTVLYFLFFFRSLDVLVVCTQREHTMWNIAKQP